MKTLLKNIVSTLGNFFFHLKTKNALPVYVKKILVISLYFRGDVLFNTASIKILKKIYPEAKIDVMVKSRSSEVLHENPDINKLIVFDDIKTADYNDCTEIKLNEKFSLLKKIRKERYDICADLTGKYTTALIALFGNFKYSFGLNYNGFGFCYTKFVNSDTQNSKGHLSDKYSDVVKEGLNIDEEIWSDLNKNIYGKCFILISESEKKEAGIIIDNLGIDTERPLICLQTTAGWSAKEWDETNYSGLLNKFMLSGYSYVLVGSDSDRERNFRILDTLSGEHRKYFLSLPLKINAAIIGHSDLFIGSDSIGLHLAGALNVPSIGLFGPTNPAFSNPRGDIHKVIYNKLSCSASEDEQYCTRNAGKSCMTLDCLKDISADEVFKEAEVLLSVKFHRKGISA